MTNSKADFKPFNNEAQVILIHDLTIENRLDRVALFGSVDMTFDQQGLAAARSIKAVLDVIAAKLELANAAGSLPDAVSQSQPLITSERLPD